MQEIQERRLQQQLQQPLPKKVQQKPRSKGQQIQLEEEGQEERQRRVDAQFHRPPVSSSNEVNMKETRSVIDTAKLKHKPENFKAGAVKDCLEKWEKITCDPWILNLIEGYEIDFKKKPYQEFRPHPLKLDKIT